MHADVTRSTISSIFLGCFALLTTSGCTTHLRPKPELPVTKGEKLKLKAALVVPAALEKKSDDLGSFDGLGSFAVDTSDTVLPAVKDVLRDTFESVEVVKSADLAPNADVVLVLKTMKFVHPSGRSSDFQLRFDLRATVLNKEGVQVIDAAYNEFIEGQKKPSVGEALQTPAEKTLSATLEKLATDLRASFGPAPGAPGEAVAAGDFSDFPPPPPPSAGAEPAKPAEPLLAAAAAPAATAPADSVVVAPAPLPAPKSNAGRVVLATAGVLLFAGGYVAPPLTMMLLNLPGGTNELSWIPIAGPLMASMTNPFLSQDLGALILTAAGTAGQVVGLALIVAGIASGGGSAPSKRASLMVEGKGWALAPTIAPGGVGLVLVH